MLTRRLFGGPVLLLVLSCTSLTAGPGQDQPCTVQNPDGTHRPCWEGEQEQNPFKLLPRDFKNVFTRKENAYTIGIGLGAAWAASSLDDRIAGSTFNSERYGGTGTALDKTFEPGEMLGSAIVQMGGAFATYGIGKLWPQSDMVYLGRDLIRAQIVTQSLTIGIKTAVGRERPDGTNWSFPSGHASTSFATATVIQRHYGWHAGIPAYVLAGFVAASRLNEDRHYLSDVVFGAALGVMAGRTVTFQLGKGRFLVTPTAGPGQVGIQLTQLP